jgi:hypothetical protein
MQTGIGPVAVQRVRLRDRGLRRNLVPLQIVVMQRACPATRSTSTQIRLKK